MAETLISIVGILVFIVIAVSSDPRETGLETRPDPPDCGKGIPK